MLVIVVLNLKCIFVLGETGIRREYRLGGCAVVTDRCLDNWERIQPCAGAFSVHELTVMSVAMYVNLFYLGLMYEIRFI